MSSVWSFCACCSGDRRKGDREEAYGVYENPSATCPAGESPVNRTINFRSVKAGQANDRHSQPSTSKKNGSGVRASAPLPTGRALPQLPGDLYTAIDKTRKEDISFVDDSFNRMYECIDHETDSVVDPLYSKVGELRVNGPERKYDYPIFPGRGHPATSRVREGPEENLYQSASQLYTAGSEDPYSSINSEPRRLNTVEGDGDTSSAYDPGYAKVQPSAIKAAKSNKLEKTERELDLLYSKIRRHISEDQEDSSRPGPSYRDDTDMTLPIVEPIAQGLAFDEQSIASREPLYRYITVRENAELVRERLRQQGQLEPPIREHYYSTIGNEYESVDGNNVQSVSRVPRSQVIPVVATRPISGTLNVSVTSELTPPPPTSPIPDQIPSLNDSFQSHMELTRRSPLPPPVPNEHTTLSPLYSVVNKCKREYEFAPRPPTSPIPELVGPNRSSLHQIHLPSIVDPSHSNVSCISMPRIQPSNSRFGSAQSVDDHHDPIHSCLGSNSRFNKHLTPRTAYNDNASQIQEFMQRPTLPYSSLDTLIARRTVEERERIIEKRSSVASGTSGKEAEGLMSRSMDASATGSWRQADGRGAGSMVGADERVYRVEIQRVPGPASARSTLERRYAPEVPPPLPTSQIPVPNAVGSCSFAISNLPTPTDLGSGSKSGTAAKPITAISNGEQTKSRGHADVGSGNSTSRSSARKAKPWKDETEEDKIRRLGTIYTAKDYVSPIDMSNERPWPMGGKRPFSPNEVPRSTRM